jgi:uncharacterized protein YjbI with pentapeptide repeats
MTKQGKFHGQQLTAKQVLQLYAAGEIDFRGTILRSCDFRNKDLSNADFSEANLSRCRLSGANLSGACFNNSNIRMTWFKDACLRNANFYKAETGIDQPTEARLVLIIPISAASTITSSLTGALIIHALSDTNIAIKSAGILALTFFAISFISILKYGFTLKSLLVISSCIAFMATLIMGIMNGFAISLIFSIVAGGACLIVSIFSLTPVFWSFDERRKIFGILFLSFILGLLFLIQVITPISVAHMAFASAFMSICLGFSAYVNWKSECGRDSRFSSIRLIGLAFASFGGTKFNGADLSESSFSHAILRGADFTNSLYNPTNLHGVRWYQAEHIERAIFDLGSMQDHRVRILLTTLNGVEQDLSDMDLQGVNLAGAKLHRANLKGTKLNGTTLAGAELHGANLTNTQCINTDFTDAHLTGACLEGCHIDETTVLESVDCQYVFLKEQANDLGWRERLPHNPNKCFEPGDFEKYFQKVLDEVKILIRGGVDPKAFKAAFQELMKKYQIKPESIQTLKRKGTFDIIGIAVPPGQHKKDIAHTFDAAYEKALPASTAQALLEAERQNKQDIIALANRSIDNMSQVFSKITIYNDMNQSNIPNITTGDGSLFAGGDVNLTGSNLTLGEISGQVSNQIQQLPNTSDGNQPSLKDLLGQLKTAIDTDSELDNDLKAEALEALGRLTTAGAAVTGTDTPDPKTKGIAQRAAIALKNLADTLSDTSKLATAVKTLLPTLAGLLALTL